MITWAPTHTASYSHLQVPEAPLHTSAYPEDTKTESTRHEDLLEAPRQKNEIRKASKLSPALLNPDLNGF